MVLLNAPLFYEPLGGKKNPTQCPLNYGTPSIFKLQLRDVKNVSQICYYKFNTVCCQVFNRHVQRGVHALMQMQSTQTHAGSWVGHLSSSTSSYRLPRPHYATSWRDPSSDLKTTDTYFSLT